MTSEDIRQVTFETVRKGYRAEDVDDFLQQVANLVEEAEANLQAVQADVQAARADRDTLAAEKQGFAAKARQEAEAVKQQYEPALREALAGKKDAEDKLYVLAAKVEEYRGQEDTLKTALINAQRMGETVVHEAKQKAEQIVREATGQSELLRQQAEQEIIREKRTLEKLLLEVNQFKTNILNLYKQHIESMSALDAPAARAKEVLETLEVPEKKAEPAFKPAEAEPAAEPVVLGQAEPALPKGQSPEENGYTTYKPWQPAPTAAPEGEKPLGRFGGALIDDD